MQKIFDQALEQVKAIEDAYNACVSRGFKMGVFDCKQIVRHESSMTTDADVQKILDRILKGMEELEFTIKSKTEESHGSQEKSSSESRETRSDEKESQGGTSQGSADV